MAVAKLRKVNSDGTEEEYSGVSASTGATEAGDFVALASNGKLDPSLFPENIGADVLNFTSGEALAAGDFIYIESAGTIAKADATVVAKKAVGYVKSSVASGVAVNVYFDDSNDSLTALTPGTTYYLDVTAGSVTATPPTATGNILQELGIAVNATTIHVNIKKPVIRA